MGLIFRPIVCLLTLLTLSERLYFKVKSLWNKMLSAVLTESENGFREPEITSAGLDDKHVVVLVQQIFGFWKWT